MGHYFLRRLLIAIPSILGISVILFTVLALAPGDPFEELATNPNVPPEVRTMLRQKFGLDDPVYIRYFHWLTAMAQGNFGFSFASRIDVGALIMQRLPTTLADHRPRRSCSRWSSPSRSASMPRPVPTRSSTRSLRPSPSSAFRCRRSSPACC